MILGSESDACFQRTLMSLEIFSPIWSYVNENKKKSKINKYFEKKNGLEIGIGTCHRASLKFRRQNVYKPDRSWFNNFNRLFCMTMAGIQLPDTT